MDYRIDWLLIEPTPRLVATKQPALFAHLRKNWLLPAKWNFWYLPAIEGIVALLIDSKPLQKKTAILEKKNLLKKAILRL